MPEEPINLNYSEGERKTDFRRQLRQLISNPESIEAFIISRPEETPIAFIIFDRNEADELKIPIFRFKETKLASTILRHCLFECFSKAASENRNFTRITENFLDEKILQALQEDYFMKIENGWLKMNINVAKNTTEISSCILNLCKAPKPEYQFFLSVVNLLNNKEYVQNINFISDIEKIFYPAKFIDVEIPTFIIPIQYWFAKELFDKELAEEVLWGEKEDLALRRECVYYRSKSASGGLKAPGRILWYVSQYTGGSSSTLGAIRACSRLDEIVIDKPVDLYKRFRRLGVYNFQTVLKTANNNFEKEIMAIRFSDTEQFSKPIELKEIEKLVGHRISVRAPYKISSKDFAMIYNKGK